MNSVCIEASNIGLKFSSPTGFFRYRTHVALSNVSFQLFKGETLGVIGRNGCGKSSLLKVIAGILEPDEGTLTKTIDKVSLQTLNAGFDRQLSGYDNAILSAMLLGHNYDEAISALPGILGFSELKEAFYEPVKTYSSGMRARLGFSVAMLLQTDVLLVDEALGVGDRQFRQKAEKAILERINSEQTVVFVSHSGSQIKRLCDRGVWLEEGQVVKVGPAAEIVDEYEAFLHNENSKKSES
jgi:lipopolysaccharide transport system ATP-binding protein